MIKGAYIVIEGAEGVGKTTMVSLLAEQLARLGRSVRIMREPDTQNDLTAHAIRRLTQNPQYPMSTRTEVLLYNAARSQSLEVIRGLRENGVICLVDRNYLTTLAIQYYGRGDVQDYQKICDIIDFAVGDMQPDLTVVLDAPASTLRERAKQRGGGERFDNLDEAFLERVRAGYLWEAKQRDMPVVYAVEPAETVLQQVWPIVANAINARGTAQNNHAQSVAEVLAANPPAKAAPVEPPVITAADKPGGTPKTAANPPAENTTEPDRPEAKPSAATAEDVPHAARVEGTPHTTESGTTTLSASGLLAAKLEAYKSGDHLELSVQPAHFDQKDGAGHYRFYIPDRVKGKARSQYIRTMNQLFDAYCQVVADLTAHIRTTSNVPKKKQNAAWQEAVRTQAYDAAATLLPVAAQTTVYIRATAQALQSLATHLANDELPEAQAAGAAFMKQLGGTTPGSNAHTYRAVTQAAVRKLADEFLPHSYTGETDPVTLTDLSPRNELDIVADMLYEHSDLPLSYLQREAARWPYQQKAGIVTAYIGRRTSPHDGAGHALDQIRYSFDAVCSYGTFRALLQHRTGASPEWQALSPRLGYEVPQLIEDAGASEAFEQCFDLSMQLYSALQSAGHPLEAQYATLLGHKLRWKVTYSFREVFRLYELPEAQYGQRELVRQMHAAVAAVHPLLADAMQLKQS